MPPEEFLQANSVNMDDWYWLVYLNLRGANTIIQEKKKIFFELAKTVVRGF